MVALIVILAVGADAARGPAEAQEERAQAAKLAGREASLLGRLDRHGAPDRGRGQGGPRGAGPAARGQRRLSVVEARRRPRRPEWTRPPACSVRASSRATSWGAKGTCASCSARAPSPTSSAAAASSTRCSRPTSTRSPSSSSIAMAPEQLATICRGAQRAAESVNAESDRRASLEERRASSEGCSLRSRRSRVHEQAVHELEEAERELSQNRGHRKAVANRRHGHARDPATASMRKARGKLPFPTARGKIEERFGRATDRRFGTDHPAEGHRRASAAGTPVNAVWDGKVVHAGWFKGFGNLMIIDHGDRLFTLMAHLDHLEKGVGDDVRSGRRGRHRRRQRLAEGRVPVLRAARRPEAARSRALAVEEPEGSGAAGRPQKEGPRNDGDSRWAAPENATLGGFRRRCGSRRPRKIRPGRTRSSTSSATCSR